MESRTNFQKVGAQIGLWTLGVLGPMYSVSSLVVPKMEDEFSGTDAGKNSK